jgi:hydrogenase maturation protein HypF
LFDGIAALALGVSIASFEGQPALLLDDACDDAEVEGYKMPLVDGKPFEIDWRGAVRELLRNARQGVSPNRIAMRFHRGLADAMISVCRLIPEHRIVLGGGVFQNQHLVEILAADLPVRRLGLPGAIPPNDGGLAAGQLAVAVSWLESTSITT